MKQNYGNLQRQTGLVGYKRSVRMKSRSGLEEKFKLTWEAGASFLWIMNVGPLKVCASKKPWKTTNNYKFLNTVSHTHTHTHTHLFVAWFFKMFIIGWKTLRASSGLVDCLGCCLDSCWLRSRLDLLWDDGQDDVLVSSPHHRSQRLVPLDGGAHVTGRGDPLVVDADDDITLLQASAVIQKEERHKQMRCSWSADRLIRWLIKSDLLGN